MVLMPVMTLTDYLEREAITTEKFAEMLGVDPVSVRRYLRGQRRPKLKVMRKIAKVTRGEVTPNDFWMPKLEPEKRARAA